MPLKTKLNIKQNTMFNIKRKNTLSYLKTAAMGFFSKGLQNEFETAVVHEPSVFEPLKVYCVTWEMKLKLSPPSELVTSTNVKVQEVRLVLFKIVNVVLEMPVQL